MSEQVIYALAAILAHLDGAVPRLDLPVDVAATAFQWRVWRTLQQIPYGETRSYAEVAAAIGRPSFGLKPAPNRSLPGVFAESSPGLAMSSASAQVLPWR